jgi:hypothetical protein
MTAGKTSTNGKAKKKTSANATKSAKAKPHPKKRSALDAAALVLAETGQPLSCPELIAAMAAKGYWSSPHGKTPASTLYAAIVKEIAAKGKEARFQKTDRGRFARA